MSRRREPSASRARPPASESHDPRGPGAGSHRRFAYAAGQLIERQVGTLLAYQRTVIRGRAVGACLLAIVVSLLHRDSRGAHREDAVCRRPRISDAGGGGAVCERGGFLHRVSVSGSWTLWQEVSRREGLCRRNGRYCWRTLRIVLDDLKSDKPHPCCRHSGSG